VDKTINIGPWPFLAAQSPALGSQPAPATLFYCETGSGPAVVLLHGFAEDGATWDNLAGPLSAHCHLIIPDLPGSGRSSAFLTPDLSMDDLAAAVKALLDHLGIDKCIMIGHSMGGYITLAFAGKYPERLSAFALFHSTAYPDSEEKKAIRRKSIEFIRKNGAELFIRQSTPGLFGHYTHQHHPELIDRMIDRYAVFPPNSLIAYYQAMITRSDRTAVLREFHGPVLFIIGEEDNLIPLQDALEQCHLPAVSHIHLVKNTGHEGMHEAPGPCNNILHDFINFVQQTWTKRSSSPVQPQASVKPAPENLPPPATISS
jgi:pimeloyl-ACP methyl ester carboxylesterase